MGMMGMQPGMPMQQPTQGGMLSPQEKQQDRVSLQLLTQLRNNPTPGAIASFADYLMSLGNPHAEKVAQAMSQSANDPATAIPLIDKILAVLQRAVNEQ